VICPKGPGEAALTILDGVSIYKYRPAPPAAGPLGYAWEFAYSWVRTAHLSMRVWRQGRFHVIQACNPPDTYWLLALLWRARGVRFVFDHHDLNPEVFVSRFGEPRTASSRAQLRILHWLERMTFRTADRVISTNRSYQKIAVKRGRVPLERTAVVRSGPDTTRMRPRTGHDDLRAGRRHLVAYLGIMGPQDGVEGVLRVAERVVRHHRRDDVGFVLLGFGDCLEQLKQDCTQMGLDGHVRFTGRVGPDDITRYLSAASIGLSPDPFSPLNDVSTMNKTMEYMAYALPVVAYRLTETVVSAADCAVYVEPGDNDGLADAVVRLLDDPAQRAELGARGRRRAEQVLDWAAQAEVYVRVYDDLLDTRAPAERARPIPTITASDAVPLHSDDLLRHFAASRTALPTRVHTEADGSDPAG